MKPIRTWILIADGARARVLENTGPGRGLHAIDGLSFERDCPPTHEIVDDREGRSFSSVGPGRSAMEPTSDPRRLLKRDFVRGLAQMLGDGLQSDRFDRLVIVAAPQALGDLRAALPEGVRSKVVGELAQDLTKTPDHELAAHLEKVLAV